MRTAPADISISCHIFALSRRVFLAGFCVVAARAQWRNRMNNLAPRRADADYKRQEARVTRGRRW